MSCAIVGALEVLGWWARKGHDISSVECEVLGGTFLLREVVTSWLSLLESIATRTPTLSYILPIATALANGEIPPKPKPSSSLLYGPLMDSNRRCGLTSCRKSALEAGVKDLLRCSGGCEGMEQYCCREHQVEDWPAHKKFCKANKRSTSGGLLESRFD